MIVLSIIRDCLDALLHPSARYDALTRARHRAFMAPRLLGLLQAPATQLVRLLGTPGNQLARVLKAHQDKLEGN